MEPKKIIVPDGLQFADLELGREPETRRLLYKPGPFAELLRANDIAQPAGQSMMDVENLAAWLIAEWYLAHKISGGKSDHVAEEVLAEVAMLKGTNVPARPWAGIGRTDPASARRSQ